MIVRLKEGVLMIPEDSIPGFNSMIVRLKDGRQYVRIMKVNTFQFYDSPIKRPEIKYKRYINTQVSIL